MTRRLRILKLLPDDFVLSSASKSAAENRAKALIQPQFGTSKWISNDKRRFVTCRRHMQ